MKRDIRKRYRERSLENDSELTVGENCQNITRHGSRGHTRALRRPNWCTEESDYYGKDDHVTDYYGGKIRSSGLRKQPREKTTYDTKIESHEQIKQSGSESGELSQSLRNLTAEYWKKGSGRVIFLDDGKKHCDWPAWDDCSATLMRLKRGREGNMEVENMKFTDKTATKEPAYQTSRNVHVSNAKSSSKWENSLHNGKKSGNGSAWDDVYADSPATKSTGWEPWGYSDTRNTKGDAIAVKFNQGRVEKVLDDDNPSRNIHDLESHEKDDTPCKDFVTGKRRDGDLCNFSHSLATCRNYRKQPREGTWKNDSETGDRRPTRGDVWANSLDAKSTIWASSVGWDANTSNIVATDSKGKQDDKGPHKQDDKAPHKQDVIDYYGGKIRSSGVRKQPRGYPVYDTKQESLEQVEQSGSESGELSQSHRNLTAEYWKKGTGSRSRYNDDFQEEKYNRRYQSSPDGGREKPLNKSRRPTEVCREFLHGKCVEGDNCRFSHPVPSNQSLEGHWKNDRRKTHQRTGSLYKNHAMGNYRNGEKDSFDHDVPSDILLETTAMSCANAQGKRVIAFNDGKKHCNWPAWDDCSEKGLKRSREGNMEVENMKFSDKTSTQEPTYQTSGDVHVSSNAKSSSKWENSLHNGMKSGNVSAWDDVYAESPTTKSTGWEPWGYSDARKTKGDVIAAKSNKGRVEKVLDDENLSRHIYGLESHEKNETSCKDLVTRKRRDGDLCDFSRILPTHRNYRKQPREETWKNDSETGKKLSNRPTRGDILAHSLDPKSTVRGSNVCSDANTSNTLPPDSRGRQVEKGLNIFRDSLISKYKDSSINEHGSFKMVTRRGQSRHGLHRLRLHAVNDAHDSAIKTAYAREDPESHSALSQSQEQKSFNDVKNTWSGSTLDDNNVSRDASMYSKQANTDVEKLKVTDEIAARESTYHRTRIYNATSDYLRDSRSHGYKPDSYNNSETVCRYFGQGCCRDGDCCKFPHDGDRGRSSHGHMPDPHKNGESVCWYFAQGYCRDGDHCRFPHEGSMQKKSKNRSWDDKCENSSDSGNTFWNGPTWNEFGARSQDARSNGRRSGDGRAKSGNRNCNRLDKCLDTENRSCESLLLIVKNKAAVSNEHEFVEVVSGSGATDDVRKTVVEKNSTKRDPRLSRMPYQYQMVSKHETTDAEKPKVAGRITSAPTRDDVSTVSLTSKSTGWGNGDVNKVVLKDMAVERDDFAENYVLDVSRSVPLDCLHSLKTVEVEVPHFEDVLPENATHHLSKEITGSKVSGSCSVELHSTDIYASEEEVICSDKAIHTSVTTKIFKPECADDGSSLHPVSETNSSLKKQVSSKTNAEGQQSNLLENQNIDTTVEVSTTNENENGMQLLRNALAEFVEVTLAPTFKEGRISKDVYKTIVKKVVGKVCSKTKEKNIPKTREDVDHYMSYSRASITNLVQAYVSIFPKT